MRAALIAAAAFALIAVAAPAVAAPSEDLTKAREAFRRGDCQTAMPLLSYLLYPTPRLAQTGDLVEPHVLRGACAFDAGDRRSATREFEEALFLPTDLSLDGTALFTRATSDFFETTRAGVEARGRRDAERRALAEERERLAIEALLRLDRRADAEARAARFHRRYPRSVQGPRIRELLAR
jgi:hypothetical protein